MVVIVAAAVSTAVTPLAAAVARRLGIVDRPGPLKVHNAPVPYLGGIGVAAGMAPALAVARPAWLLPLGLALALGVADDAGSLPPRARLAAEVAIGGVAGVVVDLGLGPVGALAVAGAVVVLVNAVNLLDGLDGLAAGVGLSSALGFAALLDGDGRVVALGLAGALVGFLVHNRPPARVYLGDGGAYLLGAALALLLASGWQRGRPVASGLGALLVVAVPVTDTAIAVLRRARSRRPLFHGDRGHVYDQLVDRGWRPGRAAAACGAAQAVLAGAGVLAARLPAPVAAAVVGAVVVLVAAGSVAGGLLAAASDEAVP